MSEALFDILRKVTTATITTMLLKKGIRRCWMNGPKPLVPERRAPHRAGVHVALRAGARGSGDAGKLGQSDFDPCRNRGNAGRRDRGGRRHGRTERRHIRRHPLRAHEEAKRRGAGHRWRAARPRRRADERAAGLVRRRRGAGLGQRLDLRRLAAADRLRRLRDLSRRRDRGRRRRRRRHSAGHGGIRRPRRRRARALRKLGVQRSREGREAAGPLSAERRGQGALCGVAARSRS